MTTVARTDRDAAPGTCEHLEVDPRGAKVRLPWGKLVCFVCYMDGVFNPPPLPVWVYNGQRDWCADEDQVLIAGRTGGFSFKEISLALHRSYDSVYGRWRTLGLERKRRGI